MKKIIPFLFLIFVLMACNMPASQAVESQKAPDVSLAQATAPAETAMPQTFEINAPIVEAPSLISIDMLDTVNGWGLTETQLLRTNDGGVTWYNVTPQGVADIGYSVDLNFFNATHAWLQFADPVNYMSGGTMYRTSDGGITWTSNTTPFGGGDISFVDLNNGWFMADLGAGAGNMAVAVYQTTDGGVNWNRTFVNDPNVEGSNNSLPLGGLKYGITPLDMQTAWINGVVYAPGSIYLYRTDDAGANWKQVTFQLPADAQNGDLLIETVKLVSPTQLFLVLRTTAENAQTLIYESTDGGNSWNMSPAKIPTTGESVVVSAQEIVFYSSNQFYVTNDAASSWNMVAPDQTFDDSVSDMDFATSQIGWVLVSKESEHRSLYRTEDGGATWFAIIP